MAAAKPFPPPGYVTDVLSASAMAFITQNRNRPFLAVLAYNTPHEPYQVPDPEFDQFRAKGMSAALAGVHGMITRLDAKIGRVLRHLDATGLAGNTVVAFLSDNGAAGPQRYNAGMSGRKGPATRAAGRAAARRWAARWPAPRG